MVKYLQIALRNYERWRSFFKEAANASTVLIKYFCCIHLTRTYLFDAVYAHGPSMLPTINVDGTLFLVDRFSPRFGEVATGSIVIVRSPENPRKIVTKRLIAKEGDSVTFLVDPKSSDKSETVVVPKGHIWVQGDNIYASRDSRAFGPVPYDKLYGKVFWRVWPIKDFGPL